MRKFFKAFAIVTVISTITRALSFLFKIYLSRTLGAEILGLYQICISLFCLFACFSSTGLPTTLSRMIAEKETLKDVKSERGIFTTCLICSMFFCGIIITAIIIFPKVLNLIFTDERCVYIFIAMLPMLITTSLYSVIRGWFWGKKDFVVFSMTELFDEIIKIVLSVTLLSGIIFHMNKLYAYAIAMLFSDIILLTGMIICFFAKGGKLTTPSHGKQIAKSATPLTVTRLFGSLMSTFMSLMIPALLVSKTGLATAEATAEFGRAAGMVMPLIFTPSSIVGSLAVVLIPEIAGKNTAENKAPLGQKISTVLKVSCIISCFFFIVFSSVGEGLASRLYNDTKSGEYLSKVAFLMLPMCLNGLVISVLNSLGKETSTFASHLVGCVFLITATIWLPKYVGIYAYFISLMIFHTITLAINLVTLSRKITISRQSILECGLCIVSSFLLVVGAKLLNGFVSKFIGVWGGIILTTLAIMIVFGIFLLASKIFDFSLISSHLPTKKNGKLATKNSVKSL